MLLLSLLLACKQTGSIELPGPGNGDPSGDDTAAPTDDSSGADDSDDPDPTDDSDEPDPDPDPAEEPDYSVWLGERVLYYDGCEATLTEKGAEVGADFEYWDYLDYYCADCDYWYYVEVSPDEACGLDIATETFRGVVFNGDRADVYYMSTSGSGGVLAEDADFDGWTITYEYETSGVLLEGVVEYPAL